MEKEAMIMGLSSEWPQTSQDVKDSWPTHTPRKDIFKENPIEMYHNPNSESWKMWSKTWNTSEEREGKGTTNTEAVQHR